MRELLLAALGAAGSLLIGLPALAQLSNTTSTFSGEVAANCSLLLPESTGLNLSDLRSLTAFTNFTLLTNLSNIELYVGLVQTLQEPNQAQAPSKSFYVIRGSGSALWAGQGRRFSTNPSAENGFGMNMTILTSSGEPLAAGSYSYKVRIDCLL